MNDEKIKSLGRFLVSKQSLEVKVSHCFMSVGLDSRSFVFIYCVVLGLTEDLVDARKTLCCLAICSIL